MFTAEHLEAKADEIRNVKDCQLKRGKGQAESDMSWWNCETIEQHGTYCTCSSTDYDLLQFRSTAVLLEMQTESRLEVSEIT